VRDPQLAITKRPARNVAGLRFGAIGAIMAPMPSIQIKDVPDGIHAVLRRRAAAANQSLQEYLRALLIDQASGPTLEEVLDRAGGRAGGSLPFSAAAAALRRDRAGR
jgi:plasmid stability protein